MRNLESTAPDLERLEREREFHNHRYADDALRRNRVGRFYEIAEPFYARYKERILRDVNGAKVLAYGVGPGGDAFELAQRGALVTGIDISETAVALAQEAARRMGLSIDFQVMNAEETRFADQSFDVVCGSGILHHLDLRKAIPEIRRLLRRDGCAVFVEPMGHNLLINLFRRRTPALRSADEHPLLVTDLQHLNSCFRHCRTDYFGLSNLGLAVAGPLRRSMALRRLLGAADRFLFTVPWLRRQAWLVLIELAQ